MSEKTALEKVSDVLGNVYTPNELHVIQSSVAKNTTPTELAYFLNVCKTVGLNPFNKEVWCYKDHKANLIIFTGRDGLLRKAQENPNYAGHRSSEVCENDEFSADIPNGKVYHNIKQFGDRGKILGAYCIVFRKDGEPFIDVVDIKDYEPNKVNPYSAWSHKKALMIKKVAESHALKQAFGFAAGIQMEDDWNVDKGIASPKGVEVKEDKREEERILNFLDSINSIDHLMTFDDSLKDKYPSVEAKFNERLNYFQSQIIEEDETA